VAYNLKIELYKDARKNAGSGWTVAGMVQFAFDTSASPAVALVQLQWFVIDAQRSAADHAVNMSTDWSDRFGADVRLKVWQKRAARHYAIARDMLDILAELEAELRGE
jgi:hypothetical protein